jgi:hypothetical protein
LVPRLVQLIDVKNIYGGDTVNWGS